MVRTPFLLLKLSQGTFRMGMNYKSKMVREVTLFSSGVMEYGADMVQLSLRHLKLREDVVSGLFLTEGPRLKIL